MSRRRHLRRCAAAVVISGLLLLIPACDFGLLGDDAANTARVEADADDPDASVRVVTSTSFTPSRTGGKPQLLSADTSQVQPPFARTYSLGPDARFFVEAGSPDSSRVTISMRVWIGSRKEFDATRTVSEETLRFTFVSQDVSR